MQREHRQYTYEEAVQALQDMPHFKPPVEAKSENLGKKPEPKKDFFSLDAERQLLQKLGNPEQRLQYIHVAGTNGKGSTCAYLTSILCESTLKVGSFTSPFLYTYNEMFVVEGEKISDEKFAEVFSFVWEQVENCRVEGFYPSEYEILTCMAFVYFLWENCDVVVLEVSLGGRMDTTNVIPAPMVTVIAPISYDHMGILGNTLTEIATEKAGIIKNGTVVVSAPQEAEVVAVLKKTCDEKQVPLMYAPEPELVDRSLDGQKFRVPSELNSIDENPNAVFRTSLLGTYQIQNAALAITSIQNLTLRKRDKLTQVKAGETDEGVKNAGITIQQIQAGIRNTTWFGRFTLVQKNPYILVDGGHNRQGAQVLRESLETYFPGRKITFLIVILKDKEVDVILDTLMPIAERVYVTTVPNARSMNENELANMIRQRNVQVEIFDADCIHLEETDVLCICGSLYLLDKMKGFSFN
jgi:dihydrofolate synthase/folylpolyglutamate synthase